MKEKIIAAIAVIIIHAAFIAAVAYQMEWRISERILWCHESICS